MTEIDFFTSGPQTYDPVSANPISDSGMQPFGCALLASFEEQGIRYQAFCARGGAPDMPDTLDIAISSEGASHLNLVFEQLHSRGYRPVQAVKLSHSCYRIVFARLAKAEIEKGVLKIRVNLGDVGESFAAPGHRPDRSAIARGFDRTKLKECASRNTRESGTFMVFLGPDGVGKTTLLRQVCLAMAPIFARQQIHRWRPHLLAPTHHPACLPHSKKLRTWSQSVAYLSLLYSDFVAGHYVRIRPALRTSTLVAFDRYYHDLLIDPKRYRYQGPMWLAKGLERIVPPRNGFFVILDADERTIFARKQQLSVEEIRRQRCAYRRFALRYPNSVMIATDQPLMQCTEEVLEALLLHLGAQNRRRMQAWFSCPQ